MTWTILIPIAALAILAARRAIDRHIDEYFKGISSQDCDR